MRYQASPSLKNPYHVLILKLCILEICYVTLIIIIIIFCQLLALISTLLDGVAKLFFLLIFGIAKPHNLSWLVPSYHLIPERFENLLDAAGIEPRSLCIVSSMSHRFIHYATASRAAYRQICRSNSSIRACPAHA